MHSHTVSAGGPRLLCRKQLSVCACPELKLGGIATLCGCGVWSQECMLRETNYPCSCAQAQIQHSLPVWVQSLVTWVCTPGNKPHVCALRLKFRRATTAMCGQEACLHEEGLAVPIPLLQAGGESDWLCDSQKSVAGISRVLVSVTLQVWLQDFYLSGFRVLVCN